MEEVAVDSAGATTDAESPSKAIKTKSQDNSPEHHETFTSKDTTPINGDNKTDSAVESTGSPKFALDSWFKTMRLSDQDLHDELFRGLELHAQLDATGAEDPSPMKAASEIMWEDAGSSRFPTNERVRECFGFSKVANNEEETCLLGLYTGLAMIVDDSIMGPAILQEWYEQNKIAEGIINTYGGQDSGYFRWFKEHRHVVDRNYLRPGGPYEVKTGWTIFHSEYMDKYRTGIDGSGDS